MKHDEDAGLTVPIAALLPLAAGCLLVGARGEFRPEVVALALALVVVVGGRTGGRVGGIAAALMATATFDLFFTQPYQSLKITRTTDLWTALRGWSQMPIPPPSGTCSRSSCVTRTSS